MFLSQHKMLRSAIVFALFAFVAVAATDIKFDEGDDNIVVLTSFGEEDTTINVLYRGPDSPVEFSSDSRIISAGEPVRTDSSRRDYTNFTIPLTFTGVGSGEFTVRIREVSVTGRFVAAGFVILEDGEVVSGDSGEVSVSPTAENKVFTYDVMAVGTDGSSVDISGTRITFGSGCKGVDESRTTISSERFVLTFSDHRVGTGECRIEFETEAITLNGVSFETVLNVKVSGAPSEPASDSSSPSEELASGIVAGEPSSDSMSVFKATIEIGPEDPDTLTASEGRSWVDMICRVTEGQDCVITDLRRGSAILDISGLVEADKVEEAEEKLAKCFEAPDCPCQKEQGYECDEVELKSSSFNAVGGAGVAAAGGLATWTIALIAVVGAFAIILVIVLGLWAVYRRSSDRSESEYSSSGPLGVPDPSDLLYAQSIVRDIYGRGDFPDGGPSQAVAEQRAREAEMREEFPRPPSSSGLSRGAGTDDASSTYSV